MHKRRLHRRLSVLRARYLQWRMLEPCKQHSTLWFLLQRLCRWGDLFSWCLYRRMSRIITQCLRWGMLQLWKRHSTLWLLRHRLRTGSRMPRRDLQRCLQFRRARHLSRIRLRESPNQSTQLRLLRQFLPFRHNLHQRSLYQYLRGGTSLMSPLARLRGLYDPQRALRWVQSTLLQRPHLRRRHLHRLLCWQYAGLLRRAMCSRSEI
jgi:hypothetical protein